MSAERVGNNIEIQGLRQTVKALEAFTPEIHKRLNDSIKDALRYTQSVAQGIYPKGAWSVTVNKRSLLGQIKARGGGSKADSWGDSSPGTRAAIFEFIGSRYSGDRPQVLNTIKSLNERYGEPGRFLWAAWDKTGKGVMLDIKLSVEAAERDLQATLDASGESY